MSPFHITKRDNTTQLFDYTKISQAVRKAMFAHGTGSKEEAEIIALRVA
jgi:hypothetical protein